MREKINNECNPHSNLIDAPSFFHLFLSWIMKEPFFSSIEINRKLHLFALILLTMLPVFYPRHLFPIFSLGFRRIPQKFGTPSSIVGREPLSWGWNVYLEFHQIVRSSRLFHRLNEHSMSNLQRLSYNYNWHYLCVFRILGPILDSTSWKCWPCSREGLFPLNR